MFKEPQVSIGYHVGQNILNYCRCYESREETQEDSGAFFEFKFTNCYVEKGYDSSFIKG